MVGVSRRRLFYPPERTHSVSSGSECHIDDKTRDDRQAEEQKDRKSPAQSASKVKIHQFQVAQWKPPPPPRSNFLIVLSCCSVYPLLPLPLNDVKFCLRMPPIRAAAAARTAENTALNVYMSRSASEERDPKPCPIF